MCSAALQCQKVSFRHEYLCREPCEMGPQEMLDIQVWPVLPRALAHRTKLDICRHQPAAQPICTLYREQRLGDPMPCRREEYRCEFGSGNWRQAARGVE